MKIIHVTDTSIFNYDGISTYINELIECSQKNNDQVLVLTTTPHGLHLRGNQKKNKIDIVVFPCLRFPGRPKFIIVLVSGLKKIIEEFSPDIIWIHTIGTLGMKVSKIANEKYKLVYTKHCFDAELWCGYLKVPKPLQWIFYKLAENFENKILKVITFSVYHLGDISKINNNKYYHKFFSVPPPINERFFENRISRRNTPIAGKLTLGFCGRCDPDKGISDTFKALHIFQKKYNYVDFEFVLIGDGTEAHLMKRKYPWMNITITGYVDNVIPYLDKLDGFVLSSLQETISLSSLEAYARGIPVFSVQRGYLSENKEKISNFHLFNTHEELADLIYDKLISSNCRSFNSELNIMDSFIISYPKLFSKVVNTL